MLGSTIGAYQVIRLLGQGGMGAVYEALNESIGRRVAIKVLHPDYARQPEIVARFFNEARAVNCVEHPSLVQIHEHGQLPSGTAYIVMEYLRGQTLSQRLAQHGGRLPPGSALPIAWQIAAALAAVHDKGIVHRDLKPANLMLEGDPMVTGGERVKILDFGIAKLMAATQHGRTASEVVMGTPTYMSPEQWRGAGGVDARADVYSLGVLLYEMLAGRPPFVATEATALIGMHLFEAPPPLGALVPGLAAGIAACVDRLLQKDREQRPTMAQAAAELLALSQSLAQRSPSGAASGPGVWRKFFPSRPAPRSATLPTAPSSGELLGSRTPSWPRSRWKSIAVTAIPALLLGAGVLGWRQVSSLPGLAYGRAIALKSPARTGLPPSPAAAPLVQKPDAVAALAPAVSSKPTTLEPEPIPLDPDLLAPPPSERRSLRRSAQDSGRLKDARSRPDAKTSSRLAAANDPADGELRTARAYATRGRWNEAIRAATIASTHSSTRSAAWQIIGEAACRVGDKGLAFRAAAYLDRSGLDILKTVCAMPVNAPAASPAVTGPGPVRTAK